MTTKPKGGLRRQRRGNVVVLVCLLLPALLGFVALSVDLGFLMYVRTDLQRTADQAVLAAVRDLEPSSNGYQDMHKVRSTIREYVERNAGAEFLILDDDIEIGRFNPATVYQRLEILDHGTFDTVKLSVRRDDLANTSVSLYFARIFGNNTADVSVTATAVLQKARYLAQGSDILPIAISANTWDSFGFNTCCSIYGDGHIEDEQGNSVPGNWGTLNIGSNSNSTATLVDQINHGLRQKDLDSLHSQGTIGSSEYIDSQIEIELNGDPGFSAGIKSAIRAAHGSSKLMPIYESFSGKGGSLEFCVVAWGVVEIDDSYWRGSHHSYITIKKAYIYDGDLRPHAELNNTEQVIENAFTMPVLVD
ncbi:MAG: pilus assembly protein TadG-related protein [Mariniblastus sp.]|nr:pilus assembly protein TadG-related protein [Mariniblastus sp.]